jgi:hypothetical protein
MRILCKRFYSLTKVIFENAPMLACFSGNKGSFTLIPKLVSLKKLTVDEYYCNEFIGCGFAIKNEVYKATNGFPVWLIFMEKNLRFHRSHSKRI